jgi:hypothetical protein
MGKTMILPVDIRDGTNFKEQSAIVNNWALRSIPMPPVKKGSPWRQPFCHGPHAL